MSTESSQRPSPGARDVCPDYEVIHYVSPRTHIRSILVHTEASLRDMAFAFTCTSHTSHSLMSYRDTAGKGGEGSSVCLVVFKQSCIK